MIDCKAFYELLADYGVDFYAGVPDSLLKDFCAYVTDHAPDGGHVITANEGGAVALAAGHYLATGRPGAVYLQNSGLGNAVNPLTSLADLAVYGIPMLMIIGWRGEPGKKDEPQHVKMGGVTLELLDAIGVRWAIVPEDLDRARQIIDIAFMTMAAQPAPFALIVPAETFAKYKLVNTTASPYPMSREEAIGVVVERLPADALVVATTGKPSRELYELREARGESHDGDFLTVGSMGHSSQIALGIAKQRPERQVVCLDGDGAVLMHMGGLANIGTSGAANYRHIVLNNGAHDSVGGQPTCAFAVELAKVATACGYRGTWVATTREELEAAWPSFIGTDGPVLLEIRVQIGARADLGRPKMSPAELKQAFMKACGVGTEG